jgi:polysaccharide export outer membrane protein
MMRAMTANVLMSLCVLLLAACAGAGPVTPGEGQEASDSQSDYRIGPGDGLNIFVFNHPQLSVNIAVRPDGKITIPLAEDQTAAGKTPTQLARDLETALEEYVRSPKVNVIVTGFRGALADQIRVVGAAAEPKSLPFRANITLLDVMIDVGGLGKFAAGNRAHIVRQVDGKQQKIKVKLDDLLNDGDIGANVPMLPGDVLIIPESRF